MSEHSAYSSIDFTYTCDTVLSAKKINRKPHHIFGHMVVCWNFYETDQFAWLKEHDMFERTDYSYELLSFERDHDGLPLGMKARLHFRECEKCVAFSLVWQ